MVVPILHDKARMRASWLVAISKLVVSLCACLPPPHYNPTTMRSIIRTFALHLSFTQRLLGTILVQYYELKLNTTVREQANFN